IDWRASTNEPAQDVPGLFPPELTVEIKALACELPATLGLPLSRLSAGRILDLYARCWQESRCAKTNSSCPRTRRPAFKLACVHPSLPTGRGKAMRVEHEYARGGAWAYLAALDVHRAKTFGRCE